jgi:alpha-L-rhamnosidase
MTGEPERLSAEHLRCEYLIDPLGIDEPRPRLSWTLRSGRRSERQSAYRVLVASDAQRLGAGVGDLWDSGKVERDRSVHVVYGGPDLAAGQRCWWAVRVWDGDDEPSPWSGPAWWEMGLLRSEEWRGEWIGLEIEPVLERDPALPADLDLQPCPFLRTTFSLDRPVRRARLYATARGLYELWLNGRRAGDQVLAPGWTDYRTRIQYQTYDVSDLLVAGDNALGAILGTGWYAGHVGWADQETGPTRHYGERPELLLDLRIAHDDGSETVIASSGAWRGTTGPIRFSDLVMGETYDARVELPGWNRSGFDDVGWQAVAVTAKDATLLVADRAEPVRVVEDLTPQAITKRDDGTWIVDLGQNIAGWVRLRVAGSSGTRVQLRFGEVLEPDGGLYTTNLRSARQTDTYVLRGGEEEVWEPRFTFHGFRYVEVTGFPGELTPAAITGRVVESAMPESGTFTCSNALVNQLQRNIVWGQRGNFLSIPTDCPQRDERLGWLADAQIFAPAACFNRDVAAFFTKWLTDVADAQSTAGAFSDVAPRLVDLADGAPAWGDGGVIIPWILYQRYGDIRLLERHFTGMARWVAWIQEANPDLLWRHRRNNDFGDWLNVGAETSKELIGTAYFAHDARLLARMARALGREEDAAGYTDLFERIKSAFVAAYVDRDGRIAGETQTGYVLALAFDLLPDELRTVAAKLLVEDIERHGWHLTTGFLGLGLLFPVLTEIGATDVAYRLLLNETYPSWGYMIRHGATTIWERWDGWTEERGFQDPRMNSFNHYAFGAVGDWLYRVVGGIDTDPDLPGFERIVLHPRPGGGLTHARATYRSLRGEIVSGWRIDGATFELRAEIPANTTATVILPAADPADVTEGAGAAASADGVEPRRAGHGWAAFEVGSGRYLFRSRMPNPHESTPPIAAPSGV